MRRFFAAAVLMALLSLLCSCGGNDVPQEAQRSDTVAITVSCAGDCTLASDEGFSGSTFEKVLEDKGDDYSYFFKNVRSIFDNDDLTIVNFEGTLSENGSRADKQFAFRGKPEYTEILKSGSVEAVTLANNHSKDYGEVSLTDTMDALDNAGIGYAYNQKIARFDIKGVKVAVVGLYQLDGSSDEIVDSVMRNTEADDLVIAEIHWGIEKAAQPEEEQVALAHKVIDLGADLVIGHHPHVVQGVEKYRGKYICYSLGNFCFGGNTDPSDTDSMIFRQTFSFREGMVANTDDYAIIPCSITSVQGTNNYQPMPLEGEERARVERKITERSKLVGDGNLDLKFE